MKLKKDPPLPPIPDNAYLLEEATGDVITLTDAAALPMPTATTTLTPIQDLHGYSNPWIGGAGKNLFDPTTAEDGIVIANGTIYEGTGRKHTFCKIDNTKTYTLSGTYNNGYIYAFYDTNKSFIEVVANTTMPVTISNIPNNVEYIAVNTTSDIMLNTAQLEQGTQATAYEPYSNICPISGYDSASYNRCGVNLWEEEVELGYYDSTGTYQSANNRLCTKNKIKVNPQNTYYCKLPLSSSLTDNFIICYDKNEEFLQRLNISNSGNGFSFTAPNNCYYINVNFTTLYTGGTTYNHDISINYPSTITTYQPYQGQSVTLTFDNTIYSGVIDWCNGVVTVDKSMVDLGDLNWTYDNSYGGRWYTTISGAKLPLDNSTVANIISENYQARSITDMYLNSGYGIGIAQSNGYTYCYNQSNTSNPSGQLCYELATPTTIQLTPTQLKTLAGYNTIYTDVGNITLEYWRKEVRA